MNHAQMIALREMADKSASKATARTLRLASYGYTHELVFTAVHDEYGTLEEDSLPFCSEASAAEWVSIIKQKHAKGKVAYRVVVFYVRDLRGLGK